jgi:hypothetical protein
MLSMHPQILICVLTVVHRKHFLVVPIPGQLFFVLGRKYLALNGQAPIKIMSFTMADAWRQMRVCGLVLKDHVKITELLHEGLRLVVLQRRHL